jgi:prepilin-type processing-associated H-X9-DG protein
MFRFSARLFAAPKTTRAPGLKARLAVERMEDRLTPSASLGAAAIHGAIIEGGRVAVGDPQLTNPAAGRFPVFFADGHV